MPAVSISGIVALRLRITTVASGSAELRGSRRLRIFASVQQQKAFRHCMDKTGSLLFLKKKQQKDFYVGAGT
jgi:hypothetical protein